MEQVVKIKDEKVYCRVLKRKYKMRIAICDDEICFINLLKPIIYEYINSHKLEAVVDTYTNGEDLVRSEINYDIIYLDYQMNELNGMNTARKLRDKNIWCSIIFITNYPDFVYEAFTVDTFRFLKKPIDKKMIYDTLDGYFQKYGNDYPILIQIKRQTITIDTKDIVFLEANGKHCIIHTKDSQHECCQTMAKVSKMLPAGHFFKINKAFIINFNYIDRYKNETVYFINGKKAYMSRMYSTSFKTEYRNYCELKKPLMKR